MQEVESINRQNRQKTEKSKEPTNSLRGGSLPSVDSKKDDLYKTLASEHLGENKTKSDIFDGTIVKVSSAPTTEKHSEAYINGMYTPSYEAERIAKMAMPGVNGYLIYNATDGVARDVFSASCGRVSTTLGRKMEPSVDSTVKFIKEKLTAGETITLHTHSQGCIILSNAMDVLEEELSPNEWKKLCEKVDIHLYGTPTYKFSPTLKVISHENTGDPVTWFAYGPEGRNFKKDQESHKCSHNMDEYLQQKEEGVLHRSIHQEVYDAIRDNCSTAYKNAKAGCKRVYNTTASVCNTAYERTKDACIGVANATKSGAAKMTRRCKTFFNLAA